MLVLARRKGQRIFIMTPDGQEIQVEIEVSALKSNEVRLAIRAPGLVVHREERMPLEILNRYYKGRRE